MNMTQSKNDNSSYSYRWFALAVILLPTLLISLNNYMVQIAVPVIQNELAISFSQAQLIFIGYSIGLSIALILGGKLGDLYGRKRILWIGLLIFIITAAIGGITSNLMILISTRIVQGLGAALIQPQILATIQVIFPPKEKNLAFGLYGAVMGIAFTFGLILGGLLISCNLFGGGWRTVFFFNLPFGILALLLLPIIPESTGEKSQKIDWLGAALLMLSILLLVYPLSEGQTYGWQPWIIGSFILSLIILTLFIFVERRKQIKRQATLIDLTVFKHRLFIIGICSVLSIYLSMFAFFFILSYFLQFGLKYNTTETSLVFLPLGIGFFLTSILSSKFVHRFGLVVLRSGALIMSSCTCILMMLLLVRKTNLFDIYGLLLLFIYGLGLGLATTPLVNTVLSKIQKKHIGVASGLYNTFMYLANSLAVAGISLTFSKFLGNTLENAVYRDYVRAFSACLLVIGLLSILSFIIFSIYQKNEKKES
ncbi:MFS transporter [Lysinibacillus fusiformis]|uniref:MFS transporter n=1 Tax=Lysinibacillus fusiformis TaxID=28031 RepID=UPI00381E2442